MFQSEYPRVEVRVVPDATRRTLRALTTGEIDVAIVSRQPATRRLRYVSLFKDELVIVAHPEHPILERKFVRPADLAGEPLVLYTMPDENSTLLHDVLRPAGVKPGPITRVQLTEGIVELVKANFGVTLMARWAAAPHLEAGTLAAVSVGRTGFNREWVAAVRTRGDTPPHVDGFLNALGRISFFGSTKQKTTRGRARLSA
jgi:LysR family transcriptional regulator for metE and metH